MVSQLGFKSFVIINNSMMVILIFTCVATNNYIQK